MTDTDSGGQQEETDRSGVVLYTEDGNPVRVVLMDDDDEHLDLVANPEEGVYGYENEKTRVTAFLEEA